MSERVGDIFARLAPSNRVSREDRERFVVAARRLLRLDPHLLSRFKRNKRPLAWLVRGSMTSESDAARVIDALAGMVERAYGGVSRGDVRAAYRFLAAYIIYKGAGGFENSETCIRAALLLRELYDEIEVDGWRDQGKETAEKVRPLNSDLRITKLMQAAVKVKLALPGLNQVQSVREINKILRKEGLAFYNEKSLINFAHRRKIDVN